MHAFDLTTNPFFILCVSPSARNEDIASAYENALAQGLYSEQCLLRAYHTLLSPIGRLDAEVSWLPGIPSDTARQRVERLAAPCSAKSASLGLNTPN